MIGDDVRWLMRRARSATLATALAGNDGWPYASLVTVACDTDASPILLFSDLSDHTRNLAADPRASLLFEQASRRANPQTGPRVSVLGRIARDDEPRLRQRFLARHPGAALYAGFSDFHVYRMSLDRAHLVGGFGRAVWIGADRLQPDAAAARRIAEAEAEILAHMNSDHADAVDLFANRLLRRAGSGWRMIAVDAEGCDLARDSTFARLDFPQPAADAAAMREILIELARRARTAG
jgi:hypothetical protein